MTRRCYLGVDVGGTFTDLILFETTTGEIQLIKVPSTPPDFSTGVLSAVRKALALSSDDDRAVTRFAHGTTVGTNAVLEGKGSKVGLLTTAGFRDVVEIGRQDRDDLYDVAFVRPRTFVPRNRRIAVAERVAADGRVVRALDRETAKAAIRRLIQDGVEAIAVSLLHSYANPLHERELGSLILQLKPDVPVTLSSDVLAEFREYERTMTTVVNAYVMPATARYLERLASALTGEGVAGTVAVMQSNGGLLPSGTARRVPVGALLSGPAAGVVGAVAVAKAAGFSDIITFDMGGTSCDVSLIINGEPRVTLDGRLAGYPIQLPMLDIQTVGAGGGSVAHVRGSALKVGPESAGASPGPVCYGYGGVAPTVSDAHAVLGHLSARRFLLGQGHLDVEAAREAIETMVARPLGIPVEDAALGILAVADDRMMHAIRVVSVEKGYDPRSAVLVAFGGAGPLHATSVARLLNIGKVLVPVVPGALSALGLLLADTRRDLVRTWLHDVGAIDPAELEAVYAEMEREGRAQLEAEGVEPQLIFTTRSADLRYRGQAYELIVTAPAPIGPREMEAVVSSFHQAHRAAYRHAAPGAAVELVNARVQAWGRVPKPELKELSRAEGAVDRALVEWRSARSRNGRESVPVFDRSMLAPGHGLVGPAIIEQVDSTTVLHRDDSLEVDRFGNLIISVPGD